MQDTITMQDRLVTLQVPARIVRGVADQFWNQYGERLARALGTTVGRIESGKHITPEVHPNVVT